ncbi:MAG: hypothetical protein FAZ92_01374 [Accumulibacter sp.]|nr:MAG: hypothetical protein FAZ92_01374 [Accumulibacter sp.]
MAPASAVAGGLPASSQPPKVSPATPPTAGTKRSAMLSAELLHRQLAALRLIYQADDEFDHRLFSRASPRPGR